MTAKRDQLQNQLLKNIPGLVTNGDTHNRLAGNLHIAIPGIPNSAAIARVRHKIAISTGSACTSGVEAPSHVLTAMALPEDIVEGSLRIGLGKFTTDEDIETAAKILTAEIRAIRELL
ncbi:MAG: aminotransferase class V-fold PLP-dependent enzyme [Phormidesmis sp.]